MKHDIIRGSILIAALVILIPATGLANNLLINSDFSQPLPNGWEVANNLSVVDFGGASFNPFWGNYMGGTAGLYLASRPNLRNMDASTSHMDGSQIGSVPEPATLLLTSLGLGMLAARRLRRKK